MKERSYEQVQQMIDETLDEMYHRLPGTTTWQRRFGPLCNIMDELEKIQERLQDYYGYITGLNAPY